MFCLLFIFFSFVSDYIQTSADDIPRMMSSSSNYRPFLRSFRHIPPQESFVKLANLLFMKKMPENGRNVYLVKTGPKSLRDRRQVICKDKECNLGPVAGYYGWNYSELSCLFVSVRNRRWFCNLEFLFLFTFEGNIQCAKKILRLASAMECTDGDK